MTGHIAGPDAIRPIGAPRRARATVVFIAVMVFVTAASAQMTRLAPAAEAQGPPAPTTVRTRLTGWVARRDGFYLYREGATARLLVGVWPNRGGDPARGRLEWRRAGDPWRLLDRSVTTLDDESRGSFVVRSLPDGYAFRMRVRVPPSSDHGVGRSPWLYFRAR